jgi:hypothetical protein
VVDSELESSSYIRTPIDSLTEPDKKHSRAAFDKLNGPIKPLFVTPSSIKKDGGERRNPSFNQYIESQSSDEIPMDEENF